MLDKKKGRIRKTVPKPGPHPDPLHDWNRRPDRFEKEWLRLEDSEDEEFGDGIFDFRKEELFELKSDTRRTELARVEPPKMKSNVVSRIPSQINS